MITGPSRLDATTITCPECRATVAVYHFAWTALVCQRCRAAVDKYDWILPGMEDDE